MATKCIVNKSTFADIADAIREKGVSGTMTPLEMPAKIGEIQTGGNVVEEKDVNFWRPDGTLLYSFTRDEVSATAWDLPAQPDWSLEYDCSVDGVKHVDTIPMTANGWNWGKSNIMQELDHWRRMDVCACYTPTDESMHMLIDLSARADPTFELDFKTSVANAATIDWGDGTVQQVGTTSVRAYPHTYAKPGIYHVSLHVDSGRTATLGAGSSANTTIVGAEKNTVAANGACVLRVAFGMRQIPSGYACSNMYRMSEVVLPTDSNFNLGRASYAFQYCQALRFIGVSASSSSFGGSTFLYCSSLRVLSASETIANVQGSAISYCSALAHIQLPYKCVGGGSTAFGYCRNLREICLGYSGSTSTTVQGSLFIGCSSIASVEIGPTQKIFSSSCFSDCANLSRLKFGPSITQIQASVFSNCVSMRLYDFRDNASVPTLSNVSAFTGMHADCKIVVPDALFDTWTAATNWSNSAIVSHIVKASEYEG